MNKLFHNYIIWIIVMVLIFSPILNTEVLAQDNEIYNFEKAYQLKVIGLLQGSNDGFNLDKEVTRIDATVMIVRLFGKESLAKQEKFPHSFLDVPYWASDYVGYSYAKGLCKGISNTSFGSEDKITLSQYIIFVLRSLGYDDKKGDFEPTKAVDKAKELGLIDEDEINRMTNRSNFIRDDMIGISFNALKVPLKDSDLTLIDKLIEEGHVSKGLQPYSDRVASNAIELVFDDINVNPWMTINYKYDNSSRYLEEYSADPKLEIINSKTHITFENLDWSKAEIYEVYFKAANKLYHYRLRKEDQGKSIEFEDKKEYGTLEVSIPFAEKGYAIADVELHLVPDDDIKPDYSVKVGSFEYKNVMEIPIGTYNIHVKAYDNEHTYSLFKRNCIIKPEENLIKFSKDEVAEIKLDIDYGEYDNMKPILIDSFCHDGFSNMSGLSAGDVEKVTNFKGIYATKINDSISMYLVSEDGWSYSFNTKLDNVEDCIRDFDLNLKVEIDLEQKTFLPGEVLVDKYGIWDSYGNNMIRIHKPNGDFVDATVEFIKGGDKKIIHVVNLGYPRLELPLEPGEYIMKVKVNEGPVMIKSASKKITIKK
ncbi:hypothetical protein R9X47_18060 [Wukongibacter baidiensis]|uniref:hypothetical protein n=1 Tax=Wukongibacter baidiensis TaxID=1723361 RepID=UPI003D7F6A56